MVFSTNKAHIELHVEDFEPIEQYYSALGFKVAWKREPEDFKGYLVMQLNDNILCFWAGNRNVFSQNYFKQFPTASPRGYGVELIIMVQDIEAFYKKVEDIANVVEPLTEQPWGLLDFRAVDPAGYHLRFTSEHDVLDPSNAVE